MNDMNNTNNMNDMNGSNNVNDMNNLNNYFNNNPGTVNDSSVNSFTNYIEDGNGYQNSLLNEVSVDNNVSLDLNQNVDGALPINQNPLFEEVSVNDASIDINMNQDINQGVNQDINGAMDIAQNPLFEAASVNDASIDINMNQDINQGVNQDINGAMDIAQNPLFEAASVNDVSMDINMNQDINQVVNQDINGAMDIAPNPFFGATSVDNVDMNMNQELNSDFGDINQGDISNFDSINDNNNNNNNNFINVQNMNADFNPNNGAMFINDDVSDINNMNDDDDNLKKIRNHLDVGNNNIFNQNNRREIIKFENVVKEYRNGEVYTRALNGVNLTIYEGQIVIFLGTSGAGKSTALNLLGGLDNVTSGRIIVDGDDIAKYNDEKMLQYRRDKLGYIFQFYNLIQTLTAKDNVELVLELCKKKKSNSVELLEQVGLKERVNNYPSQLSGGEQQRVSIARALAKEPRILICDEPTGALDHNTTRQVLDLLINTAKQKNITLIIVTHNNAITPIADVVYSFRSGEIVSTDINPNPKAVGDLEW